MYAHASKLSLANMWVAFITFALAALMGVYQVAERSGMFPKIEFIELYYRSVSSHGVIMGFVLTTFFIMGFGYWIIHTTLKRPIWGGERMGWTGFGISLGGTALAAILLFAGEASVMYTFYPPLKANPLFYVGATLLVVGSWVWCLQMVMSMNAWKKENIGEPVPLAMYAMTANAILWFITSLGVASEILFQLLPWSLGIIETIDVGLARTLFSWTLHAIVYFWLIPAYIAFYTLVPKAAGGTLFSDEISRISILMLLVFSVPIGMHHLYVDPFQDAGWKFVHMIGTFMVAIPTLITGFTVFASMEVAGRLRGGKGLFGWIWALNWNNPMVLSGGLSLLMLTIGGWGGMVNASYSLNVAVHNTQWITGHFHLIFAGTAVIMYFSSAYYMWPSLTGRPLFSTKMALLQLWLWFIGMLVLTLPWHILGLLGQPRRIGVAPYSEEVTAPWAPYEFLMLIGGVILFISALLLILNLVLTHFNKKADTPPVMEYAESMHPVINLPKLLNGFGFWTAVIVIYMIVSYGYPILQFFTMDTIGTFPWSI
ncbi:MAG: cbb3-type cytochrome c oxidase subunit I [Cocleimonas sp.]|nr:cbb3-type cytochrome c oxidase subunit I [Cocleimonas sp.]